MTNKPTNNYLLSKTELGKPKQGFHQLPNPNHVYGLAPEKDKYGAREVLSNWAQHQTSPIQQPDKDFIAMNREGIKQGFIDSKQTTDFRKGNEIKKKVKEGQKYYDVKIPDQQFTYGIKNRPSTPIKNVISNTYAAEQAELQKEREAVIAMMADDKKKPPKVQVPKHMVQKQSQNKKKIVEENNFKLSKFKNVESKIKPIIQQQKNKQDK